MRRTCSESSAQTCATTSTATTPSTPLTPHLHSHQQQKFDFDDVFESEHHQTTKNNAMNFDEMSNCLVSLMDQSNINEISPIENNYCLVNSNSFNNCVNYLNVEQNDLGILYFT